MYLEKIQLENSTVDLFHLGRPRTVQYAISNLGSTPFHTYRLYNIVQYKHYLFIDCNIHRVDLKIVQQSLIGFLETNKPS